MDSNNVSFDDLVYLGIWGEIGIDLLLLMYRIYTTPDIFLATVVALYAKYPDKQNSRKIDKLFKDWIHSYYSADFHNKNLIENVKTFYEKNIPSKKKDIKILFEHFQKMKRHTSMVILNSPREQNKLILGEDSNINLRHIAEQLTLIEWEMMKNIKPIEFMDNAWEKENKKTKAPNIVSLAIRFNSVSAWVSTEILQAPTVNSCIKTIYKFITIMDHLYKMNNFNGVAEVFCGLNNISISRLKCIWSKVSQKYKKIYDSINELMLGGHNFKKYREIIRNNNINRTRTIPYIALFLRDLTFINDGNPNYTNRGINLEKVRLLGSTILNFRMFQDMEWGIERTELYDTLIEIPFRNEHFLRRRSAEIEPSTTKMWTDMIDPNKIDFMKFTKIRDLPMESPRLRHSVSKEFDTSSETDTPRLSRSLSGSTSSMNNLPTWFSDSLRSMTPRRGSNDSIEAAVPDINKDKIEQPIDNKPQKFFTLTRIPKMIRTGSKEIIISNEKKMRKSISKELFSIRKN